MKNLNLLITFVLLFVLTLNAKAVETNQATFDVWGGNRGYLDQNSLWDFDNYEEAVKDFLMLVLMVFLTLSVRIQLDQPRYLIKGTNIML